MSTPLLPRYDFWTGAFDLVRFSPSPVDDDIDEIVARPRRSGHSTLTLADVDTLGWYAYRAALRSLRSGDPRPARAGLAALGLIDLVAVDLRSHDLPLGLVMYAIERSGGDAEASRLEVARRAPAPTAAWLTSARLPIGDAALRALGFVEIHSHHGPGLLEVDGSGDPTPSLVTTAVALADAVDRDRYRTSSVRLTIDLPAVWFAADDRDAIRAIERRARGGALLFARARPGVPAADAQQFTVFLLEPAAPADFQALADVRPTRTLDHAALALSDGELYLRVVARSFVADQPRFETEASLERFRTDFVAALSGARA